MVPEEKRISREVEELYKLQGRQTQEKKGYKLDRK